MNTVKQIKLVWMSTMKWIGVVEIWGEKTTDDDAGKVQDGERWVGDRAELDKELLGE